MILLAPCRHANHNKTGHGVRALCATARPDRRPPGKYQVTGHKSDHALGVLQWAA